MFWVRVGREGRWKGKSSDDPAHVIDAALDLFNPSRPDPPSVFFAADETEARAVVAVWAATHRDPGITDCVLIPDALLEGRLMPSPTTELTPSLSERHFEVLGVTQEVAESLASAILRTAPTTLRLRERDVHATVLGLMGDEEIVSRLTPRWSALLRPAV